MTVPTTIDAGSWLSKYLEGDDGDGDLARAMLKTFAETLMSAQASAMCQAGYGERTEERVNSRNGYRHRPWDTRVGSIDLAIPKLEDVPSSVELRWRPVVRQAATTCSSCTVVPTVPAISASSAARSLARCR